MPDKKKKIRSIIALAIIILIGLAGATFITIKLLNQPRPEERAWNQAQTFLMAGRYEEACKNVQPCLGDPELDYRARNLFATAKVNLKQFDEARAVIEDGLTEERQKQYDEALAKLHDELDKLTPDQDRAARNAELEKELAETHPAYREYLKLKLLDVQVLLANVKSLIGYNPEDLTLTAEVKKGTDVRQQVEQKLNDALQALFELQYRHPENAQVYELLGDCVQTRMTYVQKAAEAYNRESRHFRLMDQWTEVASARRRGREAYGERPGLRRQAIWAFRNACRCNPDSAKSRISLAGLLRSGATANYEEALDNLEQVIERAKDTDPTGKQFVNIARIMRADLMHRTGKTEEAIADMKALLAEEPATSAAALMYIELLMDKADATDDLDVRDRSLQEARRVLKETEKTTTSPRLLSLKGRVLLAGNEPTEAITILSQILDNLPPLEYGLLFVARSYYDLGKARLFYVERARLALEKAEKELQDARKTGVREKIDQAAQTRLTAEKAYHEQAASAQASMGIDDLGQAIAQIQMLKPHLPPDDVERMNRALVDSETTVVRTMLARGELADASEHLLQALEADLDNNLVYELLHEAVKREKDVDKSRGLTATAAKFRLFSGHYDAARKDAERALAVYGISSTDARKSLDEAPNASERRKALVNIAQVEQLAAVAGLANLLTDNKPAGLKHFQQACELRQLLTPNEKPTPQVYAEHYYTLLAWNRERHRMPDQADATIRKALQQFPDSSRLYLAKASLDRQRRRLGSAIEAHKQAIKLDPKRGTLYTDLAGLYLSMGMQKEARQQLEAIPRDAEHSFALLTARIGIHTALGDHDQASRLLPELLTNYQDHPGVGLSVRLQAAGFYMNNGEYARGLQLISNLPGNLRSSPDLQIRRALLFIAAGQYLKAAEVLETVLKAEPDNNAFYALGLLYLQMDRGDLETTDQPKRTVTQALDLARNTLKTYPELAHAQLLEAGALFQSNKTAQALELLDKPFPVGRGATANNRTAHQLRTLLLLAQGQLDDALNTLRQPTGAPSGKLVTQLIDADRKALTRLSQLPSPKRTQALRALVRSRLAKRTDMVWLARPNQEELAKLLPDDPLILINLALTYRRTRQNDKAETILKNLVKSHPDFAEAWRQLGLLYDNEEKLTQAENALKRFLSLVDDAPTVEVQLAMILERADKGSEAVQLYEKVVGRSERFPDALNNLAYHLITGDSPDIERALGYAQRAVNLAPFNANYHDTLGWCHYVNNDIEQAVTQLQRAVLINPSEPVFQYHLGMAYLKHTAKPEAERKKLAADALREALAISPNFTGANAARQELKKLGL